MTVFGGLAIGYNLGANIPILRLRRIATKYIQIINKVLWWALKTNVLKRKKIITIRRKNVRFAMGTCRWMPNHVRPVRAKSVLWISWDLRKNPSTGGATSLLRFSRQDSLFLYGGRFFESR